MNYITSVSSSSSTATSSSTTFLTTFARSTSISRSLMTNVSTDYTISSTNFSSVNTLTNNHVTHSSISASSFFTINNTGNKLNGVLSTYTGDLSGCLANCSNQGYCVLNSLQQYMCQCDQYKAGKACQSDLRPCSSNPCLNKGTCSNIMNINETSFQCICQNNLFYGTYCENKVDLCLNNTDLCIKGQGYCVVNGTRPMCKCLKEYSGIKCELQSTSMVVRKAIINASSIIAIIVLVCFIILVFFFDYTKYLLTKNKKPKKKTSQIKRLHYQN